MKHWTRFVCSVIEKQVEWKIKTIRDDVSSSEDFTYWETIQEKLPHYKVSERLGSWL